MHQWFSAPIGSSTRIEGSALSDRDVERLLSNLRVQKFSSRDEQEVAGYAKVMELVFSSWQDLALTENPIRQTHRDLFGHSDKDARHRGHYKTAPNRVEAFDENGRQVGVVFETAAPFDTPRLMSELVAWFNDVSEAERLHPLLLLQAGYAYAPYGSLESVVEQSKEDCYLSLRRTQGTIRTPTPDWQPWLTYFLRALAEQMRRLNRKLEREQQVLATLPALSLRIVEFAREHGRVPMAEAMRLTGSSRNTLKSHFRELVARGHLRAHSSGRGAWYALR